MLFLIGADLDGFALGGHPLRQNVWKFGRGGHLRRLRPLPRGAAWRAHGLYDARKAELAAGGAKLPLELSAGILRGESRLKAIRNWRDATQMQLEFKTGIGQGYLSNLETGCRAGSLETIAKLLKALNVPIDWLS